MSDDRKTVFKINKQQFMKYTSALQNAEIGALMNLMVAKESGHDFAKCSDDTIARFARVYDLKEWTAMRARVMSLFKVDKDGKSAFRMMTRASYRGHAPDDNMRSAVPLWMRFAVKFRDGDKCKYCGSIDGPFHLDHKEPWSRVREHTIENIVVACAGCNLSKGEKSLGEWRIRK